MRLKLESKEFEIRLDQLKLHAQHLRTIHFTLVITGIVLLIGTIIGSQPEHKKAIEQLDLIRSSLKAERWSEDWLTRHLYSRFQDDLFPGLDLDPEEFAKAIQASPNADPALQHSFILRQSPSDFLVEKFVNQGGPLFHNKYLQQRIRRVNRLVLFFYPCLHFADLKTSANECKTRELLPYRLAFVEDASAERYKVLQKRPTNLATFVPFWRTLNELRIQLPSTDNKLEKAIFIHARVDKAGNPSQRLVELVRCQYLDLERNHALSSPKNLEPVGLALSTFFNLTNLPAGYKVIRREDDRVCKESLTEGYWGYLAHTRNRSKDSWSYIQIPLQSVSWEPVNGPSLLNSGLASLFGLDFEEAFPSLAKSAERFKTLTWEDLETALNEQGERKADAVSLLGIQVPAKLIFSFGSLVLFAIQVYMIAYVLQYAGLASRFPLAHEMQSFPWIGLSEGVLYEWLTIVTAIVLPIVVTIMAAGIFVSTNDSVSSLVFTGLIVLVELSLASTTGFAIRRLRNLHVTIGSYSHTETVPDPLSIQNMSENTNKQFELGPNPAPPNNPNKNDDERTPQERLFADKWWNLANAIAGFGAVQGITFILAYLGTDLSCRLISLRSAHVGFGFLIGAFLFALFYFVALTKCRDLENDLDPQKDSRIFGARKAAHRMRLITVFGIGVLGVATASEVWMPKNIGTILKIPTGLEEICPSNKTRGSLLGSVAQIDRRWYGQKNLRTPGNRILLSFSALPR